MRTRHQGQKRRKNMKVFPSREAKIGGIVAVFGDEDGWLQSFLVLEGISSSQQ